MPVIVNGVYLALRCQLLTELFRNINDEVVRAIKNFSLDAQGDHVLACKRHTGATRGHNHVMDVLAQATMCVNHKVSTTAAASNMQDDVDLGSKHSSFQQALQHLPAERWGGQCLSRRVFMEDF